MVILDEISPKPLVFEGPFIARPENVKSTGKDKRQPIHFRKLKKTLFFQWFLAILDLILGLYTKIYMIIWRVWGVTLIFELFSVQHDPSATISRGLDLSVSKN
jgi:hypothetical protein